MLPKKKRSLRYSYQLYLLLSPYFFGVVLLVIIPGILSFVLAFYRYDALSSPVWVGRLNFVLAYTDELFRLSVRNSLSLVIIPVFLRVLGAFFLAYLMQYQGRFMPLLRASIFLPSIIPVSAYALAWLWILNPMFGPMNIFLQAFGISPSGWFTDTAWAKPALILMSLWQIGEGFIVSSAALSDIPSELKDVARIEGATSWNIFWTVTVPLMTPILLLLAFRDIIVLLQENLSTILLTTNGGPYYSTYTLPLFIYEQGFGLLSFGTASAATWGLYALSGLIIFVLYTLFGQRGTSLTDETFFS
jgi:multiple sugar transport system permease protein